MAGACGVCHVPHIIDIEVVFALLRNRVREDPADSFRSVEVPGAALALDEIREFPERCDPRKVASHGMDALGDMAIEALEHLRPWFPTPRATYIVNEYQDLCGLLFREAAHDFRSAELPVPV